MKFSRKIILDQNLLKVFQGLIKFFLLQKGIYFINKKNVCLLEICIFYYKFFLNLKKY